MTYKKPFAALTIGLLCSLSSLSFDADEPSMPLERPGDGAVEMKVGDIIPAEYQRESLEIKDWKNRKLKAPDQHEQWVEIKGKYILISVPTGTIKEMVNK